jgi:hypothetical protein
MTEEKCPMCGHTQVPRWAAVVGGALGGLVVVLAALVVVWLIAVVWRHI